MRNNTRYTDGIDMSRNDILLIVIVSAALIFAAFMVADMAYGEVGFYGLEELFNDSNTKVKLYNSGGFSLKNTELGIALFAHPVDKTDMMKFTAITYDGKVSRFVTEMEPEEEVPVEDEPASSMGADISRYEYENTGRPGIDANGLDLMYLKMNSLSSKQIGETLDINLDLKVPGQSYGGIEDANIQMKVVREGFTIYETSGTTDKNGMWTTSPLIEWPQFWPLFCYNVEISAEKDGFTTDIDDDFRIIDLSNSKDLYYEETYQWLLDKKPTDKDRECNK